LREQRYEKCVSVLLRSVSVLLRSVCVCYKKDMNVVL